MLKCREAQQKNTDTHAYKSSENWTKACWMLFVQTNLPREKPVLWNKNTRCPGGGKKKKTKWLNKTLRAHETHETIENRKRHLKTQKNEALLRYAWKSKHHKNTGFVNTSWLKSHASRLSELPCLVAMPSWTPRMPQPWVWLQTALSVIKESMIYFDEVVSWFISTNVQGSSSCHLVHCTEHEP